WLTSPRLQCRNWRNPGEQADTWRVVSWIRAHLPDPGHQLLNAPQLTRAWRAVMSEKCQPFDFQHCRLRKFFQSFFISSDLGTAILTCLASRLHWDGWRRLRNLGNGGDARVDTGYRKPLFQ